MTTTFLLDLVVHGLIFLGGAAVGFGLTALWFGRREMRRVQMVERLMNLGQERLAQDRPEMERRTIDRGEG